MTNQLSDQAIGVFDSGIGGLTVAAAIHQILPGEDLLYLGDTARVPYGVKSGETITRYAQEISLYLINQYVKLIVVACNTVSAVALPYLRNILRIPIIGVLEPGVQVAISSLSSNSIGIIGTPSTIESGAYQNRIKELKKDLEVISQSCPLLVPLAEEGITDGEIAEKVLRSYLNKFDGTSITSLILGCTHYPLFKPIINRLLGDKILLVDSAETVASGVKALLLRESLIKTHGIGRVKCYITDVPRNFSEKAERFFGSNLIEISKKNIFELNVD